MENFLGRKLEFNEVVHHINGDIYDNSLDNLQLMSRSEHIRYHNLERNKFKKPKVKEPKENKPRKIKQNTEYIISNQRKFTPEQILEIKRLYFECNYSVRKIGKLFSIDKSAITKILRGLSYKEIIYTGEKIYNKCNY